MQLNIQQDIPLAPFTTIRLGGNATQYVSCTSDDDIITALSYAQEQHIPVHVLGGGSNTIFSDTGFTGLVIHIQTKGISQKEDVLTVKAGEDWDTVVQYAISQNLAGIECLSGIPGSVGGTPFQNVGAYGQEVANTIEYVDAIDRKTLEPVRFTNKECQFGYRTSRFKEADRDRYVITEVAFRLTSNGIPHIAYPELQQAVPQELPQGAEGLHIIRDAVLSLRKKKSMVVDSSDPNSVSCGSFFTNPLIPASQASELQTQYGSTIPQYPAGVDSKGTELVKLSAAWLVEHAGFFKGTTRGGVGISENHSLAIINKGGTTKEALAFAQEIQDKVQETFGISLVLEPIVVD